MLVLLPNNVFLYVSDLTALYIHAVLHFFVFNVCCTLRFLLRIFTFSFSMSYDILCCMFFPPQFFTRTDGLLDCFESWLIICWTFVLEKDERRDDEYTSENGPFTVALLNPDNFLCFQSPRIFESPFVWTDLTASIWSSVRMIHCYSENVSSKTYP